MSVTCADIFASAMHTEDYKRIAREFITELESSAASHERAIKYFEETGPFQWNKVDTADIRARVKGMTTIIMEQQNALRDATLSIAGIAAIVPGCSVLPATAERMTKLATHGLSALLHQSFVPNAGLGMQQRDTKDNVDLAMAKWALIDKEHRRGHVIVMSLSVARAACAAEGISLHASETFTVPKQDEVGRAVVDYSFSRIGSPINHPELRPALESRFCTFEMPSIFDIATRMVNASEAFPGQKIVGARTDIARAYKRISIRAEDCALHAIYCHSHPDRPDIPLVAIPMVAQFGDMKSAYAFETISATLRARSRDRCMAAFGKELSGVYVDDLFNFGSVEAAQDEVRAISHDARALMGNDAIQPAKNLMGAFITIIGWACDCESLTVQPSSKAMAKLTDLFFHELPADLLPSTQIPVKLYQRAASLTARYSTALFAMRPFSQSFSHNIKGASDHASRRPNAATRFDVRMWRYVLELSFADMSWATVPARWLMALHPNASPAVNEARADIVVTTDAQISMNGLGSVVPGRQAFAVRWPATNYWRDGKITPVDINIRETVATILGLVSAVNTAPSPYDLHIHLKGDNTAAIAWVTSKRALSPFHLILITLITMLQIRFRILITAGHLSGILNVTADALSRFFDTPNAQQARDYLAETKTPISEELPPYMEHLLRLTSVQSMPPSQLLAESLTHFRVSLAAHTSECDPDFVAASFISHLVIDRRLAVNTANGYLTHAIRFLIDNRLITDNSSFRTPYLSSVLKGYRRLEAELRPPQRLCTRIPLHFPLLLDALNIIAAQEALTPQSKRLLAAAFAIGYGLSLRPGEYLLSSGSHVPLKHQVSSTHACFFWGNKPFSISAPHLFPSSRPDRFSVTIDQRKNDPFGKGGPRVMSRNPSDTGPCLVLIVLEWARHDPPPPNVPLLFSSTNGQVPWRDLRTILHEVARRNALDPTRLVPHSLRYGAIQALLVGGCDADTRQRQGGWLTADGMLAYEQAAVHHADIIAAPLHDPNAVPREHLHLMHGRVEPSGF